jgi:hypothetical protein
MKHRHLGLYTIAALVSLLVLTQPSAARIIYVPTNVTLNGNGAIALPLSGETAQFIIQEIAGSGSCGSVGEEHYATVTVTPTVGNSVVANEGDAAALSFGNQIGPGSFYGAQALMAQDLTVFGPPPCPRHGSSGGLWRDADAYLGLEVKFRGRIYYAWAHVVTGLDNNQTVFSVQLEGYAYETIPGQPINAGQTSDGAD